MNQSASEESKSQVKVSTLTGVAIIVLAAVLLFVFFAGIFRPPHVRPKRIVCRNNLKQLSICLLLYAQDNVDHYPPAERWCDALVESDYEVEAKIFRCPGVETGPCNYAINPNADPNGPGDIVLLFDSKSGWNQSGGPEMLVADNHDEPAGCCVLFNDGRVEFIKSDELEQLKWKQE